ncbi:MAG: Uma2 family endonuclease [Cyanobacteria bacterium J06623_5]
MAVLISPSELSLSSQNLKRWTVNEYHRLSELGLLDANERTELIAGQIIILTAKGTPHVTALRLLALQLDDFFRNRPYLVITQDPVQLDDLSEPEPDLVIVKGNALDYASQHPKPEDIQFIVEVADSTLQKDRQVKDNPTPAPTSLNTGSLTCKINSYTFFNSHPVKATVATSS